MDVQCDVISRDRLAFSKSILRRFIRECVDRDAAVASPWTVKADIASKYNISQDMPDDVRRGVDAMKRLESDKRKKGSEAKETTVVSPSKRPKRTKTTLTEEEKAAKVKEEEEAKAKRERDEMARQALTGCKRPVARWPIEDLDVTITEKEKASGKPPVRPLPHRTTEFAAPEFFEQFLMTWNFITTYGHAFNVSPFPLDMLEAALHHVSAEPCFLIDCLHTGIISSCRSVSAAITKNQVGVTSLINEYSDEMETDDAVGLQQLVQSLTAFGSGWEKKAVNHETWCNALVSILKEHATVQTMPTMRSVLAHLLFQPSEPTAESSAKWVSARPRDRYYSLDFKLKISLLAFLCDLSATGKAIHNAMETCETSITEMRKEKMELKKEQKRLADQLVTLTAERRKAINGSKKGKKKTTDGESTVDATPPESVVSDHESDDLVVAAVADLSMDTAPSEAPSDELPGSSAMSDIVRTTPSRAGARSARASLRFKAHDQARLANEKKQKVKKPEVRPPPTKEEDEELKNLQDELAKVDRSLEMLELDFRQYLLLARMRPMGMDRFHCKVWWFDGVGCMTLLDPNGDYTYGTGKLFIQGPSEDDLAIIDAKAKLDPSITSRREVEEGEGILDVGEWAWYETPDEVETYMEWLNVKGQRENALEKQLARWKPYLIGGMEARHKELTSQTKQPENRRGRKSNAAAEAKAPYLHYVNLYSTKQT
ncbi:hypothetical protein FRC17_005432 [Serendipita sp. 399]|nr:hypothetical protein FRC17_005432 [Serendipita sp. 399]